MYWLSQQPELSASALWLAELAHMSSSWPITGSGQPRLLTQYTHWHCSITKDCGLLRIYEDTIISGTGSQIRNLQKGLFLRMASGQGVEQPWCGWYVGLTQCSAVLCYSVSTLWRYCCFDRVAAALRPTNWVTAATLHSGIIHVPILLFMDKQQIVKGQGLHKKQHLNVSQFA